MVMVEILKIVSEKIRHPPKTEDDELISDYEEDALNIAKRKLREQHHEQFYVENITKF